MAAGAGTGRGGSQARFLTSAQPPLRATEYLDLNRGSLIATGVE